MASPGAKTDYNQKEPDGSWSHVYQYPDGHFEKEKIAPSDYGKAGTGGDNAGYGDKTYMTPKGLKTVAQMKAELQDPKVGYNGPMDDASVVAAYNRTTAGGAGGNSSLDDSWQKLVDAIGSGDAAKAEEAAKEFEESLAEKKREFDVGQASTDKQNYADTATKLLSTASTLTGPADYYQYDKYIHGGKDILSTLFGDQPRPSFQAPSGSNEPLSITKLMEELGLVVPPGPNTSPPGTTPGAPAAGEGTYQTKNGPRTIDQMLQELKDAQWPPALGTNRPSDSDIIAKYGAITNQPVTGGAKTASNMSAQSSPVPTISHLQNAMSSSTGSTPGPVAVAPLMASSTAAPSAGPSTVATANPFHAGTPSASASGESGATPVPTVAHLQAAMGQGSSQPGSPPSDAGGMATKPPSLTQSLKLSHPQAMALLSAAATAMGGPNK